MQNLKDCQFGNMKADFRKLVRLIDNIIAISKVRDVLCITPAREWIQLASNADMDA